MKQVLLVGLGGGLGSIARFFVSGVAMQHAGTWRFPLGTFRVNCLGCLIIGALVALMERRAILTAETRLFLLTGVLGGFTTFSAFALESVLLLRKGEIAIPVFYAVASVLGGFLAVWLGFKCAGGSTLVPRL